MLPLRFILPLMLEFIFEFMLELPPIFEFIIGDGDIIGVDIFEFIMFEFIMLALRAFTFTFVFPASPQPNEPAAIKNVAVIKVFLMVSPVKIK